MAHSISSFLGSMLDLGALVLYFYIFMKKRKQNIPFPFLMFSFILSELVVVFSSIILSSNFSFYAGLIRLSISLISTFLLTLFFESKLLYRIFFSISYQAIIALSEFIAQLFVQYYLRLPEESISNIEDLICFLSLTITLFFIILISIIFKKRNLYISVQHYFLLLITPIITIFTAFNRNILEASIAHPFSYVLLITGFVIINYSNFILLIISSNSFAEREKINLILKQNEYQQEKYNQLSSAYKKLRKYQHDTKKRFMYINDCIQNKKYNAVIPYLEQSMNELNSSYSRINSGNLVIDSFVSNCLLLCEDNKIEFNPSLQIDSFLIPINDYDLSIVLGNLLDNAVNACNNIHYPQKKFINLYIRTDLLTDQFVIHIINSKTQKTVSENDEIIHGYGLINIKEHIEKSFGIINFKESDEEFETSIIIPITSQNNTKK